MEFKTKSTEELEKMSASELAAYTSEKLSFEKKQMEDKLKALEAKGEEATAEIKKIKEDQIEMLKSALKEQGVVLEKIRKGEVSSTQFVGADDMIAKAVKENLENFKKSRETNHTFSFNLKAAADMLFSSNVSGGTVPQPLRLEGVNDIVERMPKTYGLIPKLTVAQNTIEWVYESAQDGTIDGTAEGAAKDQIDNDFVVTSLALVKRAAYMKVSTEMLDDATFMQGWLRNKLIIRLFLDVDNQVLNGNGSAPNLSGILNQATASSMTAFAGTVDNANEVDVLVAAKHQVEVANQDVAGLVIQMHPTDVAKLMLTKLSASDKRYVDRLISVAGNLSLDGTPIIKNTNITAGTYLIGDFSKALIAQKSDIRVEINLDGNDFTKNMRTILAEWRGQVIIENNYRTAFVKGTFSTDKAALETA